MEQSGLVRLIKALCTQESDPSKSDWHAILVLLRYLVLLLAIVFGLLLSMYAIARWGLPRPG